VNKFFETLTKIEKAIAASSILILTIFLIIDIFSREIFRIGIPWAQKSAVYLMIWAGLLGAILTSEKAAHLRPEIADKLWGEKGRKLFIAIKNLVTALFCLTLAYYSVSYVRETHEMGDTNVIINIKMWVLQLILPYTFSSMALRHLRFVYDPQLAIDRKAQEMHK
jgi:TRAP-type C4-dicarboxylate transport system permease small subunit